METAILSLGISNLGEATLRARLLSRAELLAEKSRIKQELKNYDVQFRQRYQREPTHEDKEPLRALYVYYKHIRMLEQDNPQERSPCRAELEAEARSLAAEISALQDQHHSFRAIFTQYQEKFHREHGRKITLEKDLGHLRDGYFEDLALKERVKNLETRLGVVISLLEQV